VHGGLGAVPRPTATVVGRDAELRRLEAALVNMPAAIICGLPGVGKSTLALEYALRRKGPVAYVKLSGETSITGLADAVHRQLTVTRYDVAVDDEERLNDVWSLVERFACLAVVDDVHLLPPESRDLIVDTATQCLRNGRLIAVSRELIPVSPGKPDRLQLRLEALDRLSARQLWDRLIELYGPGRDFNTAWLRSRGNPFLLRQAHVATLADANPLESVVRMLGPGERRLANALALSHTPLPREVLSRMLPGSLAEGSLRTLATRLIVDVTPDGRYLMHDLWREAINADLDGESVRTVAADLVEALRSSALDALTRVQETSRHLKLLGRHAEIGALLLANSAEMVRQGANAVLLQELDDLPPSAITPDLLVVHARTLARGMHIRRAYHELRRLVDGGGMPPQALFFLASCATVAGELDHAHQLLQQLVDDPALKTGLRAMAKLGLAWNFANRGLMTEARQALEELEAAAARALPRSVPLKWFMLLLERQDVRAADVAADPLCWLRDRPEDLWSRLVTPVLCATTLAIHGRFAEAEEAVHWMENNLPSETEHVELSWTRMAIACERGERAIPLAYFRSVQRLFDRGGHFAAAVWTRALTSRLLFLFGRRREALAELAEVRAQCRNQHASGFDRIIDAAALEDPLSPGWLTRESEVVPAKLGDVARARAKAVLRIACSRGAAHDGSLPPVELPASADYAFERALLELGRAILARRHGQERVVAQHLQKAVVHAASCGADDDIIAQLYQALLEPGATPQLADDHRERSLVIDGERHELRFGIHRLPLTSRSVSRHLLYAFAGAPKHHLTRDMIARALWDADYDPLRHESTLKSSIRRLRSLLAGTDAEVISDHNGYRLMLPPGAVFIPPDLAS
jgi:tetratricopeptide (TPR) repeat protein